MERRGVLRSWSDDKGFGFIQPEQGGAALFAHISAMHGERRPVTGDQVLYVPGKDSQGRACAEHIRLAGALTLDQPAIRRKPQVQRPPASVVKKPKAPAAKNKPSTGGPIQYLGFKLLLLAALCCLPLLGAWQLLLQAGFVWVLVAYPLASLISFIQYWQDKTNALRGRWRTPENALHLIELFGGWPGALVAQQCFRHKTRKLSYQLVFWSIVAAHQAVWVDWLLLDGAFLGDLLPL
jgi:uncharacterized membrane protein YsdA (DUF1294 family)/cold shock CspA family protein